MSQSEDFSRFANDARFSDRVLCLKLASGLSSRQPQASELKSDDDGEQKIHVASLDPSESKREPEKGGVIKRLHISSMLLASKSRFFEAMFTSGLSETTQKELEYQVADLTEAKRVEAVISFMYSSKLPSRWKGADLIDAMLLCDRLGCDAALLSCCSALEKELTVDLCSSVLALPETLLHSEPCSQLVTACKRRLVDEFRNFEKHALSDKFLTLPALAASAVLDSDELQVQSEQTVFRSACLWMNVYKRNLTSNCHKKKRKLEEDEDQDNTEQQSSNLPAIVSTGRCTSDHPCTDCLIKLSSAASIFLPCLRLPTFSVDFLYDSVRSPVFMSLSVPCPSLSSPSGPARSVRDVLELMYQEARDWQSFSEQRKEMTQLAPTILDIQLPFSASASSSPRQSPLPNRFVKRSAPLDGDEKDAQYGDGVKIVSQSIGSAYAYPSGAWKVVKWRLERVADIAEDIGSYSPLFLVEGHHLCLSAKKIKVKQGHSLALSLFASPFATMFLSGSLWVMAKNWATSQMDRLLTGTVTLTEKTRARRICRFLSSWNEMMTGDYVDEAGAMELEVHIRLD